MIYLYRYFVVLPHISHEFHDFLFFFIFGFAGKVLVHCQVIISISLSRKYPFHSNRISRSIQFNSIFICFSFSLFLFQIQMGISRSATCAITYLMIYRKMTAADAIRTCRLRRDIRPNDGFLQQLADLCNELRRERQYSNRFY